MRITRIYIKNYKSIKELDLVLSDKVNVFIGENSVGKSNIFSAIEWMLGPVYPSFNSFSKEDYYNGDTFSNVIIRVHFDDSNFLELNNQWKDISGRVKSGLNLNGNRYISDDDRQRYTSAFIGADRKVSDSPAANRWTLMGRLIREINSRFMEETVFDDATGELISKPDLFKREMERIRSDILFSVQDGDGENIMSKFVTILSTETAKQLNRSPSDFLIDLNMYDPWNYFRTLQIMVQESDSNMVFRASDLGMGVQASITIAILKAYSHLKLKNHTPILIDEPELYLHPQGRRNFYKIIRDLANSGTQVFITTHSAEFIDLNHFDEIFVVRKDAVKGTYVRQADPQRFVQDFKVRYGKETNRQEILERYQNAFENTGDSQKSCEAMFARKIVLVEGESEALILPYLFSLCDFDEIAEGITIVRCGGKSELDRFYRIYSEFGIPAFVLFDGDYQNKGKDDEKSTIEKNTALLSLFGIDTEFPDGKVHENHLGFIYRLEENLGINGIGNEKALALYKRVRKEITNPSQVPAWIKPMIESIKAMPTEAHSVLKQPQAEDNNWVFDWF